MTFSSRPTKASIRLHLPYRTWDPDRSPDRRTGADELGSGARPMGRVQIQNRFMKLNSRRMTALDIQAWTAARMIGEAARAPIPAIRKRYSTFSRGRTFPWPHSRVQRLTLRDWNLQLRQPILLVDGRMVVSVSPQEGFLHQVSELDTLGFDRPETKCELR